jgi:hypothetical protein
MQRVNWHVSGMSFLFFSRDWTRESRKRTSRIEMKELHSLLIKKLNCPCQLFLCQTWYNKASYIAHVTLYYQ